MGGRGGEAGEGEGGAREEGGRAFEEQLVGWGFGLEVAGCGVEKRLMRSC